MAFISIRVVSPSKFDLNLTLTNANSSSVGQALLLKSKSFDKLHSTVEKSSINDTNKEETLLPVRSYPPYAEIYGNFMSFLMVCNSYTGGLSNDQVKHENLCSYLDIIRGRQNRLFILSESYDKSRSLRSLTREVKSSSSISLISFLRPVLWQITHALAYIHNHPRLLVHGNLSPDNIFINESGVVKLSNFGLFAMTEGGKQVDFPFGVVPFIDPEYLGPQQQLSPKSDVFAFGLVVLDSLFSFSVNNTSLSLLHHDQLLAMISSFFEAPANPFVNAVNESLEQLKALDMDLHDFIHSCIFHPRKLLVDDCFSCQHLPFFQEYLHKPPNAFLPSLGSSLAFQRDEFLKSKLPRNIESNPLNHVSLDVLCMFWRVAGGDVENEWQRSSVSSRNVISPCILLLPKLVSSQPFKEIGGSIDMGHLYVDEEVQISMENLMKRITSGLAANRNSSELSPNNDSDDVEDYNAKGNLDDYINFLPLEFEVSLDLPSSNQEFFTLDDDKLNENDDNEESSDLLVANGEETKSLAMKKGQSASHDSLVVYAMSPKADRNIKGYLRKLAKLPVRMREQDIDYQYHRILLFQRLLEAFPHSKQDILAQARIDIPPFFRGIVWAILLDIFTDQPGFMLKHSINYSNELDDDTMTGRQIDVDVPRCHQYHPLLSSPQGHGKLKLILKSWVANNPHLAYWQGLDSVAAPFVIVNFSSPNISYACLQEFVSKYLRNLFQSDNSSVLNEYLAVLAHLIVFHDPSLGIHFRDISFHPNLYAIPWLLTLFTHVFPMDKILHFWDRVLVSPIGLVFFMALSIILQFRSNLLESDFNNCIMMFTDLPEIDIEKCLTSAMKLMQITPPSIYALTSGSSDSSTSRPDSDTLTLDASFPIPVSLRYSEFIPRIVFADLCAILGQVLIIDTRSESLFLQCHLVKAYNWDEQVPIEKYLSIASKYVVVIGNDILRQLKVAESLVAVGKKDHVSVLHGSFPPPLTDWSFFEQICYCQSTMHRSPLCCESTEAK